MSDAHELKPEERVRRIEEEAEYLEHDVEELREAAHRARRADSLASPGQEHQLPEPEPQPEGGARSDRADSGDETEGQA